MGFAEERLRVERQRLTESSPTDDFSREHLPLLWELLTLRRYSDGKPRMASTVTVSVENGEFRVYLCARQEGLWLQVVSNTLEGVWKALEERLGSDEPGWGTLKRWKGKAP